MTRRTYDGIMSKNTGKPGDDGKVFSRLKALYLLQWYWSNKRIFL